jgi:thiol-disulfide isomerase/thioredoxin
MLLNKRRIGMSLLGLLAMAGTALAEPPTDAQIESVITKIAEAGKDEKDRAAQTKLKQEAAKAAVAEMKLGEASLAQIEKLVDARILGMYTDLRDAAAPRLAELAKGSGKDGARAAELYAAYLPIDRRTQDPDKIAKNNEMAADAILGAVKHAGYGELVKSGKGDGVFRPLSSLPAKVIADKKLLEAVEPFITTELSPQTVNSLRSLISTMNDDEAKDVLSSELREKIRLRIVAAADAAIEKNKNAEGPAAQQVKFLKDTKALADGAWAKGTLIGNPAPAIELTWVSDDGKQKSFADFKGKVVMIDFWATWCGPCRAAFPKMAQLAERYKGHDVVILGLTSVQGFHIGTDEEKRARIDCKDDPKKEMELMPGFMKGMGVNWTIAFGDKSCFNPDFGVQGIPHVAIIDSKGIVRYNGLYPNPVEESEKIDALLKEAGLKAPEKPFDAAPAKK